MSKSPAFQFYPADYSQDANVRLMNYEQRGIYIELMGICWIEGSIPADEKLLARLLGLEFDHFLKQWEWIKKCFCHKSDNFLIHPRLEKEKEKQKKYSKQKSKAGKKGAESRWSRESTDDGKCHSSAIDLPLAKNGFSSSISSSINKLTNVNLNTLEFEKFWSTYPKKTTKKETSDYWRKKKLDSLSDEILNGLDVWKNSKQWAEKDGQFIPDPVRFLKYERWKDSPMPLQAGNYIVPAEQRKGGIIEI